MVFSPFARRLALLVASLGALSAHAADLSVVVQKLKNTGGMVRVGLFDASGGFPRKPLLGQTVQAQPGAVTLVFKDLAPGRYAVTAFQDLNGNQKLDTNAMGMPVEPYGFSRNARGSMGPPSFDDAQFEIGTQPLRIELDLQ